MSLLIRLFPFLPLRNGVLFPGTIITLPIGHGRSVALEETLRKGGVIRVVTDWEDPGGPLYDSAHSPASSRSTRVSGGEYRPSSSRASAA